MLYTPIGSARHVYSGKRIYGLNLLCTVHVVENQSSGSSAAALNCSRCKNWVEIYVVYKVLFNCPLKSGAISLLVTRLVFSKIHTVQYRIQRRAKGYGPPAPVKIVQRKGWPSKSAVQIWCLLPVRPCRVSASSAAVMTWRWKHLKSWAGYHFIPTCQRWIGHTFCECT